MERGQEPRPSGAARPDRRAVGEICQRPAARRHHAVAWVGPREVGGDDEARRQLGREILAAVDGDVGPPVEQASSNSAVNQPWPSS